MDSQTISKVVPQTWEDQAGNIEYGIVWLEMTNGDIYSRSVLRDETIEGLVSHFESSKTIDDECALFKTSSEREDK